jgi:CheY-like chemotaxis protein
MTAGRPLPLADANPKRFAVITTDLHLPGADGFDVLRAAHDANPSVYVGVERFPAGGAGGGEADTLREGGNPKTEDRRPGTED